MTKNNSYAMNNTLPYYILDNNNVKQLYKDYFIFCRQLSENYIENNLSFKNKKEKSLFLNILQQYFLFCFKHNVSEEEIKKTLKNVQTVSELKKLFKTVKNTFTEKKNEEKKLLLKGEIQKHLYNYQLPSLFQHRQRIYIKINKTPSLSLFIQKSIDFLNQYHLPNNNIEIIKKEKNVSFLAQNGKKKEKNYLSIFCF